MTKDHLAEHLSKLNKEHTSGIAIAGLYHAIFGEIPELGLSPMQKQSALVLSEAVLKLLREEICHS